MTITKTGSMTAQTAWRVNLLVARIGDIHNIIYYTKYGWQTSGGSYIENSTTTSDLLNLDTDEFDIVAKRGIMLAAQELRFSAQEKKDVGTDYVGARDNYRTMRYPSERKILTTTAYRFGSIDGDDDVLHNNFSSINPS